MRRLIGSPDLCCRAPQHRCRRSWWMLCPSPRRLPFTRQCIVIRLYHISKAGCFTIVALKAGRSDFIHSFCSLLNRFAQTDYKQISLTEIAVSKEFACCFIQPSTGSEHARQTQNYVEKHMCEGPFAKPSLLHSLDMAHESHLFGSCCQTAEGLSHK